MKKDILCNTCKHEEWELAAGATTRMVDMCYYPANNRKVGHATECEEYEAKKTAPDQKLEET